MNDWSRRNFLKVMGAAGTSALLPYAYAGEEPYDVIIIGAGASGLAAAHLLKKHRILMLEKESVPGGRIRTGTWESYHYPRGAEYLGKPEDEMADWFDDLGLKPIPVPPPTMGIGKAGKVYYGKQIIDFLDNKDRRKLYGTLLDRLGRLNRRGVEDAVYERDISKLKRLRNFDQASMADWLRDEGIHPELAHLVDIENRGLFGACNDEASLLFNIPEMAWNFPALDEVFEADVYTFRNGLFELVEAEQRVLGSRLVTGANVDAVSKQADGRVTVTYTRDGLEHQAVAKVVVVTAPTPSALGMAESALPAEVCRQLDQVKYGAYITMNLFLNRRVLHEVWSISCTDSIFVTLYDALRTQVNRSFTDKGILSVYIPVSGTGSPSAWELSEEALLERVLSDVEAYVPGIRDLYLGHDTQRFEHAFPVMHPGYLDILEVLDEFHWESDHPVVLAGDYLCYPTMDGALASGYWAAEKVRELL